MNEIKYDRFSDVDREPRRMSQPIRGYQHIPLVSLEKAVESIIFCCPDIQQYVNIAKSNCTNPADDLNQDESASIYLYTMEWKPEKQCLYYVLNETLRDEDRTKPRPWFSYIKLLLTTLFKLPSQEITIYRGSILYLHQDYEEGKRYVWWGFSSCFKAESFLQSVLSSRKSEHQTVFNIECNNAKMIRSHSSIDMGNEPFLNYEFLLLPGTQFQVFHNSDNSKDCHRIHLKEIHSPFDLIELPLPLANMQKIYRNRKLEQIIDQGFENKIIDLSSKDLTDWDISLVIQRIKMDNQYSTLAFVSNRIREEGTRELANILRSKSSLLNLIIAHNKISDAGIKWIALALHTNKTLCNLNVDNNQITDKGAKYLAQALTVNSGLNFLHLRKNPIGDSGVQHLAQALIQNMTLEALYLEENEITDKGITYLTEMLKQNSTLFALDLTKTLLTDNGINIFMNAWCHNETLTLVYLHDTEMTDNCIEDIFNILKLKKKDFLLTLPKNSFSNEQQDQLIAMTRIRGSCTINFY